MSSEILDTLSGQNQLLELIKCYEPMDDQDRNTKNQFLLFVSTEKRCLDRTLECGHITASSFIVDEGGIYTLLTHHRKLGKWLQLGGHVDGDPHVLAAAIREAREESGLLSILPIREGIFDLDVHEIPAGSEVPRHLHYDIRFLLRASRAEKLVVSDESHDVSWVELSGLKRFTAEWSVLRMKEKWDRVQAFFAESGQNFVV